FDVYGQPNDIRLIDLSNGTVYLLSDEMIEEAGNGLIKLKNIPITDTPLLLTFGAVAEEE
ncbi:MAG: hypothetical protein J6B77_00525, partial [Clostridia bacterium]|nr:hypothetical protein [Clostridia bacterium]